MLKNTYNSVWIFKYICFKIAFNSIQAIWGFMKYLFIIFLKAVNIKVFMDHWIFSISNKQWKHVYNWEKYADCIKITLNLLYQGNCPQSSFRPQKKWFLMCYQHPRQLVNNNMTDFMMVKNYLTQKLLLFFSQ